MIQTKKKSIMLWQSLHKALGGMLDFDFPVCGKMPWPILHKIAFSEAPASLK